MTKKKANNRASALKRALQKHYKVRYIGFVILGNVLREVSVSDPAANRSWKRLYILF